MSGARLSHGLALGLFGGLSGVHAPGGAVGALLGAVLATLGGLLLIGVLKAALGAVNRSRLSDAAVVLRSVDEAFVLLLPYALIAALAEGVLGWSAVQAFTSAGLMTAAGLAGAGVIAQGGRPLPNLLLPMLLGGMASAFWILSSSVVGAWR